MSKSTYNVIFCGTPEIAVPFLQSLVETTDFNVTAVITQPDRPVGRKQILTTSPVKEYALQKNLPVLQPEKITSEIIKNIPCDYLVVVAYGQILSNSILRIPTIAPVNVHMSLLPRWRGASPIQTAIASADTETGVSIQKMVYKLDAGDIIAQASIAIKPDDTSDSLSKKLIEIGIKILPATLREPLKVNMQNEDLVTYCHKLSREDGEVNFIQHTAAEIYNKWRAYFPWPGVTAIVDEIAVKIIKASLHPTADSIAIPCKNETMLYIESVQEPGKTPVTGRIWQTKRAA